MRFYDFYLSRFEKTFMQLRCIMLFAVLFSIYLISSEVIFKNKTLHITSLFIAGWFLWTFTEYILHRFWMHGHGKAGSSHTYHHTHPTEISVTPVQRAVLLIIVTVVGVIAMYVHPYLMIF